MAELTVRPDTLRDTARRVDRSADELDEVRQRLDGAGLTHEDWGTSWVTDEARQAYQRTHHRQLASIRSAVRDLRETAQVLRASADRYEQAEADSTPTG